MGSSDTARVKNRRTFLSEAAKCGALLVGGSAFGDRAVNAAALQAGPNDARAVQEIAMQVRVFGVARRAPGLTKKDVRSKSYIALLGYGSATLREAMKSNDNRQPLVCIMSMINDSGFGIEGQMPCPAISDRDFVVEYAMGIGDTVVGTVNGTIAPPPPPPGAPPAETNTRAGRGGPPRGPTLPAWSESGTDLRLAARQVHGEGVRPLGTTGREKGMHFIKMAPTVAPADHAKAWQALHEKALEATPRFARDIAGYELMQRLPDTAATLANRCGSEMPVPDLVASFWSKTNAGAGQFQNYVRALRQADQESAIDGASSFFVLVEEAEVFINPTFTG